MVLSNGIPLQTAVRRQMLRGIGRGLRSHPLPTVALLAVVAVSLAIGLTVLAFAALLAGVVAAVLFLMFMAARELFRPPADQAQSWSSAEPIVLLRGFLAAVDEFGRLFELALSAGIEQWPAGRVYRRLPRETRRLGRTAGDLVRDWRGSSEAAACMYELEAAVTALEIYISELRRQGLDRSSAAALSWRREDLSRRRDALAARLRACDFRAAACSASI